MLPRGERRRRAGEEAARFQDQLTAFGEMLAGHPFATDRPGTTHMMAVEYARALDAYDKATREAARNPAPARAEPRDRAAQARSSPEKTAPARTRPEKEAPERAGDDGEAPRIPAVGAAKPRLRDRYAPEQLLLRSALTVLAGWVQGFVCLVGTNLGLGLAGGGFVLCTPAWESWGALRGGRVLARYES
ncbi:hypothetical protein [Streptomyces sp. NPDC002078]